MKIQELTVIDPSSLTPSVRLRISDSAGIEDAGDSLSAFVTIDRKAVSLENIEQSALDEILELVASARTAVKATTDELQKLHS